MAEFQLNPLSYDWANYDPSVCNACGHKRVTVTNTQPSQPDQNQDHLHLSLTQAPSAPIKYEEKYHTITGTVEVFLEELKGKLDGNQIKPSALKDFFASWQERLQSAL